MNANTLKVYEILKDSWGEKKASTVMDYLENEPVKRSEEKVMDKLSAFATKEDMFTMKNELVTLIADKYANTIKWLFVFWIGTMGTVIGIIKFL